MNRTTTIENCKITSVSLGLEDHGILTAHMYLEGDGWGCGFGGYVLDNWDTEKKQRVGSAYGTNYILRILKTLEVDQWEKLPGTPLRAETERWGGGIVRIGHLFKDKWFDPREK